SVTQRLLFRNKICCKLAPKMASDPLNVLSLEGEIDPHVSPRVKHLLASMIVETSRTCGSRSFPSRFCRQFGPGRSIRALASARLRQLRGRCTCFSSHAREGRVPQVTSASSRRAE